MNQINQKHQPVMVNEVLEYLSPKTGEAYLDLTAGYGGHAKTILARTQAYKMATLVDRDQYAIAELKHKFADTGVKIVQKDFLSATSQLKAEGQQFDLILADLGISSPHINKASRGFSFQAEGPLDMRMDTRQQLTAEEIVNNYSKEKLVQLIKTLGEEPKAVKIAEAIVANRPITTTTKLAEIIAEAVKVRSKIHPATKTFQALRISVNDELGQLEQSLPMWTELLKPGGRIAVISFHSLEDRLVKHYFKSQAGERYDAPLRLLTKRPVVPSADEIVSNPRARSAKLRAAAKQK